MKMPKASMRQLVGDEILETALVLLNGATTSFRITMDAEEELRSPTPDAYFQRLKQRATDGLHITRIGFGSENLFAPLGEKIHLPGPNYAFHRTDATDYRRMLLADESRLMFAVSTQGARTVYLTTDAGKIMEYLAYFRDHLQ